MARYRKPIPEYDDVEEEDDIGEHDDLDEEDDKEESPPPPPKKPRKSRAKKPEKEHDCDWKKKYAELENRYNAMLVIHKAEVRDLKTLTGSLEQAVDRAQAEADSAAAAFSESLRQVAEFEKAVRQAQKETPGKIQVFKLANAALALARYARALEGDQPTPGSHILNVEEVVKGMV